MFGSKPSPGKIIKQLRRINALKAQLDEEIMIYNIMVTGSPQPAQIQQPKAADEKSNNVDVM